MATTPVPDNGRNMQTFIHQFGVDPTAAGGFEVDLDDIDEEGLVMVTWRCSGYMRVEKARSLFKG